MSKNTYLKVSQTEQPCNTCQGLGFFYSKEHHNQLKKRMCYMCSGAGKQSSTVVHVDATEEVADLRRSLENVTMLLHQATKRIERLQAGLKD